MTELFLKSVRPWGGTACDMRIKAGKIVEMATGLMPGSGAVSVDGTGCLALPGLVNAHTHMDKTLWGEPWHPHRAGPTVAERIANERAVLKGLQLSPQVQSERLAQAMIAKGTTHVRSHVDIDHALGLHHFHGVQRMRERYRGVLDIEIVAFPQSGVMTHPTNLGLLEQAVREGAELVGGIDPMGIDRDPKGQLDGIFGIAERHGVGVDIHLHEPGEMGAISVELIADRTRALGMHGKVVISHAFCLGSVSSERREALTAQLVDLDIAIMSHGPGGGASFPPVRRLDAAGVRVFCGTDGVRDAWGPLNSPDMLQRAFLVSYVNGFRDDDGMELSLKMATYNGANVMAVHDYGLKPGCAADLVLVCATTLAEAVVEHPPRMLVVKRGEIVARDGRCVATVEQLAQPAGS